MSIAPPTSIPPFPTDADPLITDWPAAGPIVRVYDPRFSPRGFWAGNSSHAGRFHPFTPAGADAALPVLYGSDSLAGAISETVFHDVPVRGTKHVALALLASRVAVSLVPARSFRLADLTGFGLRRLGATRAEIIDSDPRSYLQTAQWAQGLHAHSAHLDGIQWVSRQFDRALGVVLFGDRVAEADLSLGTEAVPTFLSIGTGFDQVAELADQADITLT